MVLLLDPLAVAFHSPMLRRAVCARTYFAIRKAGFVVCRGMRVSAILSFSSVEDGL